jgi:hypothetical protein
MAAATSAGEAGSRAVESFGPSRTLSTFIERGTRWLKLRWVPRAWAARHARFGVTDATASGSNIHAAALRDKTSLGE